MTITATRVETVAEAITANEAHLAQWIADGQTDPIDRTTTAPAVADDESTIEVPVEVLDVEHFTKCDGCDRYVIVAVTGHQNCNGTYCDSLCFDANACHRECQ